jgi:uncharacterized phage infection (PIP) family protein YhgE
MAAVVACLVVTLMPAWAGQGGNFRERFVDQRVNDLKEKLALTDAQVVKIREMYTAQFDKMREQMQNQGQQNPGGMRGAQTRMTQLLREKVVPVLDPDQVKRYADMLAKEATDQAAAVIASVREKLGLAEDAWTKLEPELKKLADLKAELTAKSDIARAQLRQLVEEKKDDAKAIGEKLKTLDAIKKDLTAKIDEQREKVRKAVSETQWAQLVVEGAVD